MTTTLFYGALDPIKGVLRYINAGHDPPILVRSTGEIERLRLTGPVIGLLEDAEFDLNEMSFQSSDMLLIFSDGVVDLQDPSGERYGMDRLLTLSKKGWDSAGSMLEAVVSSMETFLGDEPQFDDVTMLAFRKKP